jgi:hypothetical protein
VAGQEQQFAGLHGRHIKADGAVGRRQREAGGRQPLFRRFAPGRCGGKQEGVMGKIKAKDASGVENFGGVPDQLVKARAENAGGFLKNQGDMNGVALVDRILESGASNHQKSEAIEALQKAAQANQGVPAQDLFNNLVKDPKFSELSHLAK